MAGMDTEKYGIGQAVSRFEDPRLDDLQWDVRPWNGSQAHAGAKLHDALLATVMPRRRRKSGRIRKGDPACLAPIGYQKFLWAASCSA